MTELKHPTSALHEYAQQMKLPLPIFQENRGVNEKTHKPEFSFTIVFNGKTYGPALAPSKNAAKTEAASMVCDDLQIYHDGATCTVKALSKSKREEPIKAIIVKFFEYCRVRKWPTPECTQLKEEGEPHNKMFYIQYNIGDSKFPVGAGRSKDFAKRRAAALALSELQGCQLREYVRGPICVTPFGQGIAEVAWETFGIICEELEQDEDFCRKSELCAFILEDKETGLLRTISIGTGNMVAHAQWRVRRGESIIDAHALIVARRALLVYLYEQLLKLIKKEPSIFMFSGPDIRTLVALKRKYEIHLYMKNPPCGDARWFSYNQPSTQYDDDIEVRNDHWSFYNSGQGRGSVQLKGDRNEIDIVSCSDKLMLWNYVGLQGALLSNFVTPIFINSITVSNNYAPENLTRAFCCRFDPKHHSKHEKEKGIVHPWMQCGTLDGIERTSLYNDWRNIWSIYWSHEGLELTDDQINLTENVGILDALTGCHLTGSEREGRIPIICKRNYLRSYRKICLLAGAGIKFVHGKSYYEHKNMSTIYKTRKNEFFKHLDMTGLGRFPLMDRNVDDFYLQGDDQRENPIN